MASSGFLCICPQKTVEFGDKNKLRDAKAQQLAKELGFDGTDVESSEGMLLCGGGIRVLDPTDSLGTATLDSCAVVFQGVLSNGKELLGMRSDADNVQITAHQAATIVCSLYAHHGVNMVPVLEGQYAFCLYDAKQGRVLAARDASGSVPLRQARSSLDSLIISTCAQLPEGSHDEQDIPAGSFKYGWHASPRPFTPNKPLGDMHPTCHRQQPVSLPSSKAASPRSPTVRQGLVAELDAAQQHLAAMASPLAPVPEHAGRGKGRAGMQQEERRHSMDERSRGRRSMDARRSSIEQPRRHSIDSHKGQQEHGSTGRRSLDLQPGRADAHDSWTRKEQPAGTQKGGQRKKSSRQQAGAASHNKPAQAGLPDSWHVVHHHHNGHGHSGTPKAAAAAQASKAKATADGNMFDALGSETESICSRTSSRSSPDSLRSHGSGASRGSRRSHGSSKGSSAAASPTTAAAAAAAASAAVAGLAPASSGPSPKPPRASSAADSGAAAGNMARLMANLLGPSMPAPAAAQSAAVSPLELWSGSAAPEPAVPAGGASLKETRSPSCGDLVALMAAGGSPPAAMPGLAH